MKYTYEQMDVVCGIKVKSSVTNGEVFMVGYNPSVNSHTKYCIVSLADGMIVKEGMTRVQTAEWINNLSGGPQAVN